jgi:protein-disulfide isomerase
VYRLAFGTDRHTSGWMAAMRPTVRGGPSRKSIIAAFAVAVVATVAIVALALVARDKETPDVVPTPVVSLAGIPQDGSVLGQPAAKVTLIEYADQQCPGCRYYTLNIFPALVNEYVRPGKVKMAYRGYPFIGPDSLKALRFLLAAALQKRLWQLQEALYRYQGAENDGWVTDDLIRDIASKIAGLDVDKLFTNAESDAIAREAEEQRSAAEAAGIPGTPAFLIGIDRRQPYAIQVSDLTQFRQALDDALSG